MAGREGFFVNLTGLLCNCIHLKGWQVLGLSLSVIVDIAGSLAPYDLSLLRRQDWTLIWQCLKKASPGKTSPYQAPAWVTFDDVPWSKEVTWPSFSERRKNPSKGMGTHPRLSKC
jgi:hypothetical protein